ncbi:MAG TPA: dockerin type I repeat-containing protein, partial [Candidatus Acidoferrum sp.]|nr:dockerin type I repeat-containing protein [Candidatus Acidoferrum sp.]
ANAIRWGTMYNFRFDSNRPPQPAQATLGFFKTGTPITVPIEAPAPCAPLSFASAISRKTHGSAGDFDIDLPLTDEPGVECRESGGHHTFIVAFSNPLVSGTASVTSGIGSIAGKPVFEGNTMTLNLSNVTDAQKLTIKLSQVTDSFSQVLPEMTLSARMLIGDANGSRTVNATDITQVKTQSGLPVTAANFRSDVNASGTVNGTDVSQVKASAGNGVP